MAYSAAYDEGFLGGCDDVWGDRVEDIDGQDAADLVHEAFDEAEVAAGDPDDAHQRFDVWFVFRVEDESQAVPVLGQHRAEVFGVQRQVVVGEADPAVQLRVADQTTDIPQVLTQSRTRPGFEYPRAGPGKRAGR